MKKYTINDQGFIVPVEKKVKEVIDKPLKAPKICAFEDCTAQVFTKYQGFCSKHRPSKKSKTGFKTKHLGIGRRIRNIGFLCTEKGCISKTYNNNGICTRCFHKKIWHVSHKKVIKQPVKRPETLEEFEDIVRKVEGKC